jgi:diaminopimelate epimerase
MPAVTVTKCCGTGNDFVLLDARALGGLDYPALAKQLCPRRFSLGADGLLAIETASIPGCDARMRVFNADGSEAETCGNGIRCVAAFLHKSNQKTSFTIETAAGIMTADIVNDPNLRLVRVCMGVPAVTRSSRALARATTPHAVSPGIQDVFEVSMGNPHVVVFVSEALEAADLECIARSAHKSKGEPANVELVCVADQEMTMRVHERGVGETWACGSGACAAAAAAIVSSRTTSPVRVRSKGGSVEVEWSGPGRPAYLTGDALLVYTTRVEVGEHPPAVFVPLNHGH